MRELFFVRHGERIDFIKNSSEYLNWIENENNRIHDPSLSARGSECAFLLGQHLVKNEFIFSKKKQSMTNDLALLNNDTSVKEPFIHIETTLISTLNDHHNGSASMIHGNVFGKPVKKIIIFSSPYRRCLETARSMLNGIQSHLCSENIVYELIESHEQFRELFVKAQNQTEFNSSFYSIPGFGNDCFKYFLEEKPMESVQDLEERCKIAMDNILNFVAHENEDDTMVFVVTHAASLIKAVEALLTPEKRIGVKAGTCGLSQMIRPPFCEEWLLKINSDTSFLDGGQMYYWDFGDYETYLRNLRQQIKQLE
ncbi:hypothetical protein C9374_004730 [Naegleria lovaniensis]|uniref:Phosphoglycerate mutase family protein n=1 Tax=Naegleria lovaniensis TaxID=51637 RepID=A0AA88GQM9_NAELO|nr:uncharacterized protein C9374_004730 [Naegleria lovaniensis]KAG2382763.1 hypothetical protein C9374_004730 [Naegleria lovaniensis]